MMDRQPKEPRYLGGPTGVASLPRSACLPESTLAVTVTQMSCALVEVEAFASRTRARGLCCEQTMASTVHELPPVGPNGRTAMHRMCERAAAQRKEPGQPGLRGKQAHDSARLHSGLPLSPLSAVWQHWQAQTALMALN